MKIKQMETEEEYNKVIDRIDQIFDAASGSEDAKELDLLVSMVNLYESKNFPIEEPNAADYRKIRREEALSE
ncbi:hypothetical protein [Dyadobacter sp. LHD-138]|uniref:hypothetical protein n=1 Tax=Dyadobacter sp. LHD-138 TaxID=3071413 RepID=UPI0027E1F550|nr:hypothetical protein [Dyadobacter sp. LHD-138]MDQ6480880.1 hypothetical protein [Dyadobacter sp. LHD-138]